MPPFNVVIFFLLFFVCLFVGAKEFASEALKATSEYASQAGEILQAKVPEAIEGIA